ncbi:MAG: hypothetical protein D3X82_10875 [Candidatus Leucobacter sulfamidivorax]|nr:hypothetical protein [Candidatus Leucobacter sulfamidivorax]
MSIGKYLTNFGVIGALLGALGTLRQTQAMPKDWRRYLIWGVWAAGLVLAIVSVAKQPEDEEHEERVKETERLEKARSKALAKAERKAR